MRGFGFYLLIGVVALALAAMVAGAFLFKGKDLFSSETATADQKSALPGTPQPVTATTSGELTLVCEVSEITPVAGFGTPGNSRVRTVVAGIDFEKNTGWYQGSFVISETRKGTLSVEGNKLSFTRPAMFERFGSMISKETVQLDRSTGAIEQALELGDGRSFGLVKGYCGRLLRAPF